MSKKQNWLNLDEEGRQLSKNEEADMNRITDTFSLYADTRSGKMYALSG